MRYRTLCKFIAAATLFSLLARWRAFSLASAFEHGSLAAVMGALTVATLVLALVSVVGMWGARTWGFVAFYPFGVLFTVVFGASLIPFVLLLCPVEARVAGVFVVNGIVLALVALVHWKHPR
jgi:hypothetical protein